MEESGRILVVDDDEDVLLAARMLLKKQGYQVQTEKDPHQIPQLLREDSFDAVLLDMNFTRDASSGREGFYWLEGIVSIDPQAVVVLITAYGDVEMAVRAIKAGAFDFVLKPWQNQKLLATVAAALSLRRSRQETGRLRSRQQQLSADMDQPFTAIIGQSTSMHELFRTVEKIAPTDASVLILGENGSGKEVIAREIHRRSLRADDLFISVDMGAISESLFESELFGHVKGAFTDAKSDRAGRFEIASGGSLFLDEIGNLSPPLQAKLLTVLQNREIVRLGANKPVPIDVRLICATNMPIAEMVTRQEFRQDLLYRINTVELHLPPLRERPGDIPLLVDHFLGIYGHKYKKLGHQVGRAAMDRLQTHTWPGNVRELQHAVERALIMGEETTLRPEDFLLSGGKVGTEESLAFDEYNLEEVEKQVIELALRKHQGNVSHAARELGLTRTSLYRRMEKYGL